MSSIIPIVSSSPPPMDEDQTFGWDEDDDFGNFASAPTFGSTTQGDDSGGGFVADWPASSDSTTSGEKESSPESSGQSVEDEKSAGESWSGAAQDQEKSGENAAAADDDDDFADFAAFQNGTSKPEKPHLDSLPLKTSHQEKLDRDPDSDSGKGAGDTVMEKSRESTATDSGLFSTDLSPLPQSESLCISEGEKTMHSDDETFSDMPQDSQSDAVTPSEQGQKPALSDLSQEEDSQCEDSKHSKEARRQSDTPVSSDPNNQPEPASPGVIEGEEVSGESSVQDDTGGSLCQNKCSRSASPVVNSGEADDHNQSEVSSIPDVSAPVSESDKTEKQSSIGDRETSPVEVENEVQESGSLGSNGAVEVVEHSSSPSLDTLETQGSGDNSLSKSSDDNNEEGEDDDDDSAAFESKPSPIPSAAQDAEGQQGEPEDLVLRKDSVCIDDDEDNVSGGSLEDASISEKETSGRNGQAESAGEERDRDSAIAKSSRSEEEDELSGKSTPADLTDSDTASGVQGEETGESQQSADPDEPIDIPSVPTADDRTTPVREEEESGAEDDGFGDFRGETVPALSVPPSEDSSLPGQEDGEDFAKFSSAETPQEHSDDFGDFSSQAAVLKDDDNDDDDDDDFGDFNSGSLSSSAATATKSEKDDFGAFSNKSADPAHQDDDFDTFQGPSAASSDAAVKTADGDDFGALSKPSANTGGEGDFGDFSAQQAASSDSGWADFGGSAKPSTSDDDFGNFSASAKTEPSEKVGTTTPTTPASLSSHSQDVKGNKLETALKSCFPLSEEGLNGGEEEEKEEEGVDLNSADKSKLGVLETILEYGLLYRSASQQTWQVVKHPSRKDPRVRLWGQLQAVDGSPAVVYQWSKSSTNSHLFHTLHIDTQNMLIGHKKRSVPIFATGLSLLEPIRGGRKEREAGGAIQTNQNAASSVLSPSLVGSNAHEPERRAQEIPAVDFDWSTSGLTNPLTSHSLDLDFLVAQDSHASDRPSDEWDWVFQSELLDAPRASVRSSQPLEDILKNAKPTSVRSRRDESATSQMSPEAVKVLGNLPDFSFMLSKVLMFPIKN